LYTACIEQGHGDCVQLLLDAHADADQEGSNGVTPLIAACRFASLENILLDEELSACLANTGIAKMDAGPEASRAWFRVKRRRARRIPHSRLSHQRPMAGRLASRCS
jgi:ankyrin repeat protein